MLLMRLISSLNVHLPRAFLRDHVRVGTFVVRNERRERFSLNEALFLLHICIYVIIKQTGYNIGV